MRGFYQLVFPVSGEQIVNTGGREVKLVPKDFMLFPSGHIVQKDNSDLLQVSFPYEMYESLQKYLGIDACSETLEGKNIRKVFHLTGKEFLYIKGKIQLVKRLEMDRECKNEWNLQMRKLFFMLMTKVMDAEDPDTRAFRREVPSWLESQLEEWDCSKNRQQGLEFFCERSGFSKEHICRTFKKYLGVSPTVFLNQLRLERAIELMSESNASMIDIAYESGFKSLSRFYHVFREKYGMSPKQFIRGKQ